MLHKENHDDRYYSAGSKFKRGALQPTESDGLAVIFPDYVVRRVNNPGASPEQSVRLYGNRDAGRAMEHESIRRGAENLYGWRRAGYEAQLVNAVICTRGPLTGRSEYDWFGPLEKVIGKFEIRKNDKCKEYRVPGWRLADEEGIGVKIWATLRGEDKPRELTLLLSQARTRNSTLWADDPRQQLAYLAVKRWARLYCPEVILGVYTSDELEERSEKVINPEPKVERVNPRDIPEDVDTQTTGDTRDNNDEWVITFRQRIESASNVEETTSLRQEVENVKHSLGIALYTELKGKVVQRHHRLNAVSRIEKMINDLPDPDEPDAVEKFTALENTLNAAKPHLGELYEGYIITLNDIKPEYIAA